MGVKISGVGIFVIEIEGVDNFVGIDYVVLSDCIEAGTFMVVVVITQGNVFLKNALVDHLHSVIAKMEDVGVVCQVEVDGLWVIGLFEFQFVDVVIRFHLGFFMDMQA